MSQRTERVDELLRQEIGRILAKDVQDPHIGFATVTAVETTPDLRHARVRVSVIGGAAERAETVAALERAMGYVRHELGGRLRIRRIPALHVSLDESAERGTRMLRILEELERGDDAAGEALADAPITELLPTPVRRIPKPGDAVAEPTDHAATEAAAADAGSDAGAVPAPGDAATAPAPRRDRGRRERSPGRPRGGGGRRSDRGGPDRRKGAP
jgi:ribosome-binding factor A